MSREAAIERLEQWASKTNMTQEEEVQYEREWKAYNDFINTLDFAEQEQEGFQEGFLKGFREAFLEGFARSPYASSPQTEREGYDK